MVLVIIRFKHSSFIRSFFWFLYFLYIFLELVVCYVSFSTLVSMYMYIHRGGIGCFGLSANVLVIAVFTRFGGELPHKSPPYIFYWGR